MPFSICRWALFLIVAGTALNASLVHATCVDTDPSNKKDYQGRVVINGKTVATDKCFFGRIVQVDCSKNGETSVEQYPTPCGADSVCTSGSCSKAPVSTQATPTLIKPKTLTAGWGFYCHLNNGKVTCSGDDPFNGAVIQYANQVSGALSIVAAHARACAILQDSSAVCWGKLSVPDGNDVKVIESPPTPLLDASGKKITGITQLIMTDTTESILTSAGTVLRRKFLFYGVTPNDLIFKIIPFSAPVTELSAGSSHLCAILKSGAVECSNANKTEYLKNASITDAKSIEAFAYESGYLNKFCASKKDLTVRCWQFNSYFSNTADSDYIIPALYPSTFLMGGGDAYGYDYICGASQNNLVKCINSGNAGCTTPGDGTIQCPTPFFPSSININTMKEFAESGNSTCVKLSDGKIKCWGDNKNGEMGLFEELSSGTPKCVNAVPRCLDNQGNQTGAAFGEQGGDLYCNYTNGNVKPSQLSCNGETIVLTLPAPTCNYAGNTVITFSSICNPVELYGVCNADGKPACSSIPKIGAKYKLLCTGSKSNPKPPTCDENKT